MRDKNKIVIPESSALYAFFEEKDNPEVLALGVKDAFDAMMEGAALMLDFVTTVEYTYVTKSGNTVHVVIDSP